MLIHEATIEDDLPGVAASKGRLACRYAVQGSD